MIGGVFSRITFKLGNVGRNLGEHGRPILIMEKGIIDKLVEIGEAQASHIGKQGRISGHTCKGSSYRVTLFKTLVTT